MSVVDLCLIIEPSLILSRISVSLRTHGHLLLLHHILLNLIIEDLVSVPWRFEICSMDLKFFDAFYNFDSVQSYFDTTVIFKILIRNEIYHCAIQSQIDEILFVLRQSQRLLEPDKCVFGRPTMVLF